MTWGDVGHALKNLAPTVASMLPTPAGSIVGGLVAKALGVNNTPDDVATALEKDPEAAVKLRQIEADQITKLAALNVDQVKATLDAITASTASINQTMQVEAKADHWPTYSWRPFIGFCFGIECLLLALTVMVCFWSVMFMHYDVKILEQIPAMLTAILGVLAAQASILGIASYFRGKMQADPNVPTDNRG